MSSSRKLSAYPPIRQLQLEGYDIDELRGDNGVTLYWPLPRPVTKGDLRADFLTALVPADPRAWPTFVDEVRSTIQELASQS